jgi:hypothetical protein
VAGTLNLNPANAQINTIGTNATVRLVTPTADFAELDLLNVYGTFGCYDEFKFTTANAFTLTGTFEVRLGDPATNEFDVITGVELTAAVPTLTGATVDVLDNGLTNGGTFTIMTWSGGDAADVTLGSVPNNGLLYELVNTPSNIQINASLPAKGLVVIYE